MADQGAAPQTGELPETGNELRDDDGDLISSGKHLRVLHQGGYVCDTCTNVLGLNVRWDHAIKRDDHAPVPSSGVDEDKLAERAAKSVRSAVEAVVRGVLSDAVTATRVTEELEEAGLLASSLNQAKIEAYIKKLNGKGQHARKY